MSVIKQYRYGVERIDVRGSALIAEFIASDRDTAFQAMKDIILNSQFLSDWRAGDQYWTTTFNQWTAHLRHTPPGEDAVFYGSIPVASYRFYIRPVVKDKRAVQTGNFSKQTNNFW